jgi:hypothetical protein
MGPCKFLTAKANNKLILIQLNYGSQDGRTWHYTSFMLSIAVMLHGDIFCNY